MAEEYTIRYEAENTYEHSVIEASWQFLIIPEENQSQGQPSIRFENSQQAPWEFSINGFGFPVIRVRNRLALDHIRFKGVFRLRKEAINPFSFDPDKIALWKPNQWADLSFRIAFSTYLRPTALTLLPIAEDLYRFEASRDCLENLQGLSAWVFEYLDYKPGLTGVDTTLDHVLKLGKGVCQDFAHLFIAIARQNQIPARYVSGYLHQGMGFFGDAQMHAWAEAWVPGIGWMAFDPTNNIMAASDHIKVAHGRDYLDCAPIKGVVFGPGTNETIHSVQVQTQQ